MKVVSLLESMWGSRAGRAPRWFRINPNNLSGRRLYRLVGDADLTVTNCCPQLQDHARKHGTPDPFWVLENLTRLQPFDVLLVCGKIAQRTYEESGFATKARVIYMMHPAARTWTNIELDKLAQLIRRRK